MKPAAFRYIKPGSLEDACGLLEELGDEAKLLAGGQSLVPLMNFRLARPSSVIDINGLQELSYARVDDNMVAVGALTREATVERSALVAEQLPILSEATRWIGHVPIRARGTIGGSLAHNDPSAEYPLMAILLEAEIVARSAGGERQIPADQFLQGYLTTTLAPGEIVAEVRFPRLPEQSSWSFQEVARRRGDFAIVAVGAVIVREDSRVVGARLAVGGAAPVAFRASAAEALLQREAATPEVIQAAAELAAEAAEPDSDIHGSAAYRRHLVSVLARRALSEALSRA